MNLFKKLMTVAYKLNDPETGCPWDVKQNFESLQKFILEEACELIDAVDEDDDKEIIEELGDVLYIVIFYAVVAEKKKRFTIEDVLEAEISKLIHRHPHVFGDKKAENIEDVKKIWMEAKKQEKASRRSIFDGIPKTLSTLAKTQKILSKLIDYEYEEISHLKDKQEFSQHHLGQQLLELIWQAEKSGIDAEKSLREALSQLEKNVREKEGSHL